MDKRGCWPSQNAITWHQTTGLLEMAPLLTTVRETYLVSIPVLIMVWARATELSASWYSKRATALIVVV